MWVHKIVGLSFEIFMLQDFKKIDMWKFLEVTFTLHQASQGEHQKE